MRPPERMPPPVKRQTTLSDDDPINTRILALAIELGNAVLQKKAAGDLMK
jgi:hypothetical protein